MRCGRQGRGSRWSSHERDGGGRGAKRERGGSGVGEVDDGLRTGVDEVVFHLRNPASESDRVSALALPSKGGRVDPLLSRQRLGLHRKEGSNQGGISRSGPVRDDLLIRGMERHAGERRGDAEAPQHAQAGVGEVQRHAQPGPSRWQVEAGLTGSRTGWSGLAGSNGTGGSGLAGTGARGG